MLRHGLRLGGEATRGDLTGAADPAPLMNAYRSTSQLDLSLSSCGKERKRFRYCFFWAALGRDPLPHPVWFWPGPKLLAEPCGMISASIWSGSGSFILGTEM